MHCARRAASRADCTAGSNSAIRTAMIAITTSSSIKVKPFGPVIRNRCRFMGSPPNRQGIQYEKREKRRLPGSFEELLLLSVGQFERGQRARARRDLGVEQGFADVEISAFEAIGAGPD